MGFLQNLFKARDKPNNATAGSRWSFWFGSTLAGRNVTEQTSMQVTAVYACVKVISEAVACLPLHTYRYIDRGKEKAIDHPLYDLLYIEPNRDMSSFIFRETLMTHLLLWGNAYAQIIRNQRGQIIELYPLLPNRMKVNRAKNGQIYYEYTIEDTETHLNSKAYSVVLSQSDVLHIPGLGFDGLIGYSPIAMAKNAIGLALATEEFGSKFFSNGASPSGVLEHPGKISDPDRLKKSWNESYKGTANAQRVAVLEEGMKYQQIGIAPGHAQFLETRKFQINEIARIFKVPPHMIGDLEKSSFSNIEQQSLEFVKYTLDPWLIRFEQSMMRSLLVGDEKKEIFFKFNVDGLLRGDYISRMNGYAIGRQNGFLSTNDIRELENMERISEEEGGDLYLVNGSFTKLADAGAFAKNTEKGGS